MDFSRFLPDAQVLANCELQSKASLIRSLVEAAAAGPLFEANPGLTIETVEAAILAREALGPTVIAPGVACPHARIPGLIGAGGAAAVLANPFDFGAPDMPPVDVAVVLIVPAERPPVALKLLAKVAAFGDPGLRERLKAASHAEAAAMLRELIFVIDTPLLARDVMRAPLCFLTPDTPVSQVVENMAALNIDAMGITSPDGVLVGEITSDILFTSGMPEFFSQLKSVSFIKEFDPFEGYFDQVARVTAGDLMSTDFALLDEEATILEVIFQLSVKRHAKVYVQRNGKLTGVIDRARVLNEILHP
jgi:mannitol/fructose-specific phosphotransferase system IIA component (Ntr-type)/predicted transcriptional regulator